jgi:hypothetical protein
MERDRPPVPSHKPIHASTDSITLLTRRGSATIQAGGNRGSQKLLNLSSMAGGVFNVETS